MWMYRLIEMQTYSQMDVQTYRQVEPQKDGENDGCTDLQTDKKMKRYKQTNKMERYMSEQTYRQADL